ncbi:formate dehydrogenase accessory sulfurtransferase FdhD [Methylohalobius crimeensis]|uniref:formate dehydrogenase accessory sulfurtransferase FdhD n=1 Tax=Methylohalobius crimeensis TaxID=244365 RepID=UPI0003B76221|nr:formate dehydrogenase accessory sulfurtransferase FdhD [Methylohalobius crimeensis]
MDAIPQELGWPGYRENTVERWQGAVQTRQQDFVAEEVPVSLIYNDVPHVVMLATPLDLEDFALGFSLTEGIIADAAEIGSIRVYQRTEGIEVRLRIPEARAACLTGKGRNLTGRTGCGLCGAQSLRQAVRHPSPVGQGVYASARELQENLARLRDHQTLNRLTGAVHAAAWVLPENGIQKVREDVGRHNALDKLIGVLSRTGTDFDRGYVLVTSRASYEMVQKCATMGITLMAAISAPTALAIRLAEETGLTLIGFARGDKYVVYTHAHRLVHSKEKDLI